MYMGHLKKIANISPSFFVVVFFFHNNFSCYHFTEFINRNEVLQQTMHFFVKECCKVKSEFDDK